MWVELLQAAVTIGSLIWAAYLWTALRRTRKRQTYSSLAEEMQQVLGHGDDYERITMPASRLAEWIAYVRELQTVLKVWYFAREKIHAMRQRDNEPASEALLEELTSWIDGVEHGNEPIEV